MPVLQNKENWSPWQEEVSEGLQIRFCQAQPMSQLSWPTLLYYGYSHGLVLRRYICIGIGKKKQYYLESQTEIIKEEH